MGLNDTGQLHQQRQQEWPWWVENAPQFWKKNGFLGNSVPITLTIHMGRINMYVNHLVILGWMLGNGTLGTGTGTFTTFAFPDVHQQTGRFKQVTLWTNQQCLVLVYTRSKPQILDSLCLTWHLTQTEWTWVSSIWCGQTLGTMLDCKQACGIGCSGGPEQGVCAVPTRQEGKEHIPCICTWIHKVLWECASMMDGIAIWWYAWADQCISVSATGSGRGWWNPGTTGTSGAWNGISDVQCDFPSG